MFLCVCPLADLAVILITYNIVITISSYEIAIHGIVGQKAYTMDSCRHWHVYISFHATVTIKR